jgi:uncharacterized membrane protein SpoIIM required for sporulation
MRIELKYFLKLFSFSIVFHLLGAFVCFCLDIDWINTAISDSTNENVFTFSEIFLNNLNVNFSICIIGFFTAGLYAFTYLFFNGFVMGSYFSYTFALFENPYQIILRATLPHCMEFMALWLSGSIGLFGFSVVYRIIKGERALHNSELSEILRILIFIIIITAIAAYLEVNISIPWVKGEL